MEVQRIDDSLAILFKKTEMFVASAIDVAGAFDKNVTELVGSTYMTAQLIKHDKSQPSLDEARVFISIITQAIRQYAVLHRTSPDVILDYLNQEINTSKLVLKVMHEPESF